MKSFLARGAKALAGEAYELVLLTYDPDVEVTNIPTWKSPTSVMTR